MFRILTVVVSLLYGAIGYSVTQGGDAPVEIQRESVRPVSHLQVDPAVYTLWATMNHPKVPKYARTIDFWLAVARCETAHGLHGKNQWRRGYNWKETTVTGAMGIATSAWLAYGGAEYAPRAARASKWEQMIVAYRIGFIGWQTDEYRTWEDRANNKPMFREAAGFDQGWGGSCRKEFVRKATEKKKKP